MKKGSKTHKKESLYPYNQSFLFQVRSINQMRE